MKFKIGKKPEVNRLLAIVAMGVEEQAVLKAVGAYEEIVISKALDIKAKVFKKNGKELILVSSGIGIVNAGMTTALIADKFELDGVLLFGVAGSVDPSLEIGDLVLASRVIQHDSVHTGDVGAELMAPGAPFVSVSAEDRESPIFETDSEFRAWFNTAVKSHPNINYREGTVLSGNEFVGTSARKNEIAARNTGSLVVEMEAAGIALVAKRLNLPVAVLKTVADRLNPDDTISSDYNRFIVSAAENSGNIMGIIWRSWTDAETGKR